ncbi:EscC/YscC/HrcC family type III secretion system outer membrane ring protein [Pokkaliibacter plantistimulans]|uniref:Type 3 secretion system secretin n=1 Tax=Proteobacteria bacterium 228 TaxID=2083153 RepID=A0A2S5KQL4_9PROT|nr:type III secretion system outer membrane ring subunit SctC [Pokkaliibacter plantistimulans]PPC77020.1 EscC/YscC/HrcC family type III secretion system outer membrane ring protein [Pokkaliibacter plantistimulans]
MRRITMILALLGLLYGGSLYAAVPAAWKTTAFAYDAQNTPLELALSDFARTFGVKLDMGNVSGTVDGKLRANNAEEYLDRLALEHQFLWFVYNGTLYVSPQDEQTSISLDVSEDAVSDLKDALTHVGLLDERFGWGELPDEGVVIVSGPQQYVEFVKELSKKKKKGDDKLEVMVFPLKYALADDRSIKYRGQSIVVPGVASMLSGLLEKKGGNEVPLGFNTADMTMQSSINALDAMQEQATTRIQNGVDNRSLTQEEINQKLQNNRKKGGSKVSADIRNNAVLIQDDPEKEPMYQALIDKLDQPRSVIEIDAIILDIDRSKVAELGINWRIGSGSTEATFNASGVDPFIASGSSATVLIQDFGHFFTQIRALESKGDASLIANPSILTIENQPAVIDFNDTAYITAIGERVANITPVTAGTSLQVIPRSIGDGPQRLIQLSLDIEDGSIEQSDGSTTPSVNRGTISTQAVIRAERSLVVGGFNVEQNQNQNSKIPLLGDLPGVGNLFKYKSTSHSNRERLFIITPRLVGTEVNPIKYVSDENRHEVDQALRKQKERSSSAEHHVTRGEVEDALSAFADHYVPKGFQAAPPVAVYGPEQICHAENMLFLKDKVQWYANDRFAVVIGAVRNNSAESRRFDEASCDSRETLAVAVLPGAALKPWQQAEVMVAVRIPDPARLQRPSLIEPAASSNQSITP